MISPCSADDQAVRRKRLRAFISTVETYLAAKASYIAGA